MRLYKLTEPEVAWILAHSLRLERDPKGNPLYFGRHRGQLFRVVVARDDPDYVITVHERRR